MQDWQLTGSPVDRVVFRGRQFYVKRDDLLSADFAGNKARKLAFLMTHTPAGVRRVVSHGSAQSNFLFSLSALAKHKQWQLDYYVDHVPAFLQQHPVGNYRGAKENGANICLLSTLPEPKTVAALEESMRDVEGCLFVPEGGRHEMAEWGIKTLAHEITQWAEAQGVADLTVMLPSGTGTTAWYLQQHVPFTVLTCPCVGDRQYLQQQWQTLLRASDHEALRYPTVLIPQKKAHFGKLYDEYFAIWRELYQETGIEFELLYDPLGWMMLWEYIMQRGTGEETFLYIHQGGVRGNESMLPRYQRRYNQQASR